MEEHDPYHLETLHPQMWANIEFLRDLADELEFNPRFNWHGGKITEREVKGRKYKKYTGEVKLTIWLYDGKIAGKSIDSDEDFSWPDWW